MDDLKINYSSGAKKELETLIDDVKYIFRSIPVHFPVAYKA